MDEGRELSKFTADITEVKRPPMAKFELGGLVPRVRLINRPLDGTHPRHVGENFEKIRRTKPIRVGHDANRARIKRINSLDSEKNKKKANSGNGYVEGCRLGAKSFRKTLS